MKEEFLESGFVKLDQLIQIEEVNELCTIYDNLLNDKKRTIGLRGDLSGESDSGKVEKITQIMRPALVEESLLRTKAYLKAHDYAKMLLGDDIELDFDMLINKAPFTNTETPCHQDAAYWINMPDKRAVSCWIALDDVYEENGCMWFIPRSKEHEVLEHKALKNGGALFCDADLSSARCVPLNSGGCTFHDGFTLHFSKGNNTSGQRRALILNFRPKAMIEFEREKGINHIGDRKVRQ